MQTERPAPARTLNLLDLAPVLNRLAKETGTKSLSLGINHEHFAIALQPAEDQAIDIDRLRQVFIDTGVYPDLFNQMDPKRGYATTSGPFGAYSTRIIATKRGLRWEKARRETTLDELPWRLVTVLFEHTAVPVDVRLYRLLPHFANVPITINGFAVDPVVSTVGNASRERIPVMFKWSIGNAAGRLYHSPQLPCGVLIEGTAYHLLEDFPPFVALVEQGEIGVEDRLMIEIARNLREQMFEVAFGANQTVHPSDLNQASRDERLPQFLAGEAGDDLLQLLGFGFRTQFRGVDLNYLDGLGCRNARTIAAPLVPEKLSRASVALLPEEINLVSEDDVLWGVNPAPVQVKTSRPLRQADFAPVAVNLVDTIMVRELALPYLYLEPGSEIVVNETLTPIVNRPVLLLARRDRSMLEVFLTLAANPLLLEGILANLYARDLDIWDAFMNAVPTEQYGAGFEFDAELFAIALLCHAGGVSDEEKALIALLSNWLHETSLTASYETRVEEDLTCHSPDCDHQKAEKCIEGARHALMAFLLDPRTVGLPIFDYTQYFQMPVEWRSERQKEVVDDTQRLPTPA